MLRVIFLCCWRKSLVCLFWNLLALGWSLVLCRYGGFWMSFCWLIFPGVSFLVFSIFGFKPPASGFSLILTVASRLLHSNSTPFKENGLPFLVPGVLRQCSEVVLENFLSVQLFFWWICRGESDLPILFLHHIGTAPIFFFFFFFKSLQVFSSWQGRTKVTVWTAWTWSQEICAYSCHFKRPLSVSPSPYRLK